MLYLLALAIFAALAALVWFLAVAAYRSTVNGHDPATTPHYASIAGSAIGYVSLVSFVPNPVGLAANLLVWAVAVFGFLAIPWPRRVLLFGYLTLASLLERLVVLGVLDLTK